MKEKILNVLKELSNVYSIMRSGLAGSYANSAYTDRSDVDVVLDSTETVMGIYLTDSYDRAKSVASWKGGAHAYVYTYKINITDVKSRYNVKEFRGASLEWIKYIVYNRNHLDPKIDYDLVVGQTADARTQYLVNDFIRNNSQPTDQDYQKLKVALVRVNFGTQLCIKSQRLLDEFNASRVREEILW